MKQLEEIRKDHQIDQKLAEERDQMDVEQEWANRLNSISIEADKNNQKSTQLIR